MRKLLIIAFLSCLPTMGFAALSATVVWEIQTGGDDNNGGGFNSASAGDDLSTSVSATLLLNDMATSVLGSSNIVSAAAGFTSEMVGNTINIASGTNFTAGFYEITTVQTSTSVIVDRTPTPSAAGSVGTGRIGGCLFSPGKIGASVVAGNKIWLKYGTYTSTTTTANVPQGLYSNASGTLNDPVVIQSYEFSRGDSTGNRSTYRHGVNAATASLLTITGHVVNYLILDSNGFTGRGLFPTTPVFIKDSKFTGFSGAGISNNGSGDSLFIFNTEFSSHTSGSAALINASGGNVFIFASTFRDNGTHGINNSSSGELFIDRCIFDTNKTGAAGSAITNAGAGQMSVTNSTFYNSGAAGIHLASSDVAALFANNIFEANGGWGVNFNAASTYDAVFFYNNAFYNNTSGSVDFGKINSWQYTGHVEGVTGTFFTDAPNMDFSLNNTTDQGALVRSLAFPATYPGIPTNSYDDIGAARHQDPATGTTNIFNTME